MIIRVMQNKIEKMIRYSKDVQCPSLHDKNPDFLLLVVVNVKSKRNEVRQKKSNLSVTFSFIPPAI